MGHSVSRILHHLQFVTPHLETAAINDRPHNPSDVFSVFSFSVSLASAVVAASSFGSHPYVPRRPSSFSYPVTQHVT